MAIVNGLAVTFFETEKPRNLPSQFFPTAPVTPPVEPTREPEAQSVVPVTTPVIPKPRIDLVPELPQDGVIIDPLPTTALSEISREPATPAVATSEPASRFVAAKARPRGDVARWVTTEDYPTADVRAGNTGTVGFRLSIDVTGRVRDCSITRTSGHPGLDAATCRHVTRRALRTGHRHCGPARNRGLRRKHSLGHSSRLTHLAAFGLPGRVAVRSANQWTAPAAPITDRIRRNGVRLSFPACPQRHGREGLSS
ncbi:TonB family protein [Novosphingobium panipatense]